MELYAFERDRQLLNNTRDCYSDIVSIGGALYISRGEWALGLDDEDIFRLLTALETRFPKRFLDFATSKSYETISSEKKRYPRLLALASSIELLGWDSFNECFEILSQSREKHEKYLKQFGHGVQLFHKDEKRLLEKREKFLERVRRAKENLLEVYSKDQSGLDAEEFSLFQHPSNGMKDYADRVYSILERHWRCNCSHRAARPTGAREARLSLIRHRHLATKTSAQTGSRRAHLPAKFEVLLPVCKDSVEWKVTNVEVQNAKSQMTTAIPRRPVNHDVCQYLLESAGTLQVDFLIENEKFWHLKPKLLESTNHYATMEPLWQLLGDGISIPYISRCRPQDRLILCYILATSMLFLYPSSWLQPEWSSNMVYFIRHPSNSTSPILTFPYVSVELQQGQNSYKSTPHHMQSHSHPAILALGIIFLEIVTGTRFEKSCEQTPWEQYNKDNYRALQLLNKLEKEYRRNRTKRISSGLNKAIRACLKLEPPPTFPSNSLTEERPIRHYILSCIVCPLAHELQTGYEVRLEDLQTRLDPERDREVADVADNLQAISRRSTVEKRVDGNGSTVKFAAGTQAKVVSDAEETFAERREACLFRDREEPLDDKKAKAAKEWFEWHNDAKARIAQLRNSNVEKVKIAILDSGIELSENNRVIYDNPPQIQYKSWIDEDPELRDEVGHGTHLATIIRQIAPYALVHVGRVFKKKPNRSSAGRIAQAIQYAVNEWEIDIIVMSFGFGEEDDSLYDAIKNAASKGVLMFAAASNDGKNRPDGVAWPARDLDIICVHSGDRYGAPSMFTPAAQDSMRFMVLGECVKSAWPGRFKSPGDHKLMSGTSCAAPIAAGIAALVLDYARGFLDPHEWTKLRRVSSMRSVFEGMTDRQGSSEYWWIKHWKWFDSRSSEGWIEGEIRRRIL